MSAQTKTLRWWATIVLCMILVFGIRVWNLSSVPPGLTHDEASNGHDSAAILEGERPIYFPVGYGHEPLYNYSVALTTIFLGQSIFTLRITTVAWSLAQCLLTAALARRWWGRQAAVFVLAAYGANFWALMLSRVGLRAPTLPALLVGSVLAYDHAITSRAPRNSWAWYTISGMLLGASLYTYMASRGMPLLYVVFLAALAITDRVALRRVWAGTLTLLTIAALVSAPLFLYLGANPELEQRIGQLGSAITALGQGQWRPVWTNIGDSLPMLFTSADPQWLYNLAGRPGLEPLLAILFVVGLVNSLSALRSRRGSTGTSTPYRDESDALKQIECPETRFIRCRWMARGLYPQAEARKSPQSLQKALGPAEQIVCHRKLLLLTWIAGGLAPALLTPVDYNLLHAVAAMPAVMLTVALGANTLNDGLVKRLNSQWLKAAAATAAATAALIAFVATIAGTAHAYFVTWAENRNTHVAYHQHVVTLGRYLEEQNDRRPVVITSLYPGEYHDPYTMEVTLRREDLSLRWTDGRDAIFVPSEAARLVVEEQTQPPTALWTWLSPDLTPLVTLNFREDDIPAVVRGYNWDAPASWDRLAGNLAYSAWVQAGDPPPAMAHSVTEAPISFADIVTLTGYRWETAYPGATLSLLTAWKIDAATDLDLVIFAHLLSGDNTLIAQDDRMAAPSWQWQAGDRLVHLHHLVLPAEMAPGSYVIALGLYDRATLTRLPIDTEPCCTDPPATRLLLPLEVQER